VHFNNTANAWIADGAEVKAEGDVEVASDTNVALITYTKQGGEGHKFGIEAGVGYSVVHNQSLAYIEDTANVSAGADLGVHADYTALGIAITGSTSKAPIGVGASVAWNEFTNDTQAFIGNHSNDLSGIAKGSALAGENLTVEAATHEQFWAFTYAGT